MSPVSPSPGLNVHCSVTYCPLLDCRQVLFKESFLNSCSCPALLIVYLLLICYSFWMVPAWVINPMGTQRPAPLMLSSSTSCVLVLHCPPVCCVVSTSLSHAHCLLSKGACLCLLGKSTFISTVVSQCFLFTFDTFPATVALPNILPFFHLTSTPRT